MEIEFTWFCSWFFNAMLFQYGLQILNFLLQLCIFLQWHAKETQIICSTLYTRIYMRQHWTWSQRHHLVLYTLQQTYQEWISYCWVTSLTCLCYHSLIRSANCMRCNVINTCFLIQMHILLWWCELTEYIGTVSLHRSKINNQANYGNTFFFWVKCYRV